MQALLSISTRGGQIPSAKSDGRLNFYTAAPNIGWEFSMELAQYYPPAAKNF